MSEIMARQEEEYTRKDIPTEFREAMERLAIEMIKQGIGVVRIDVDDDCTQASVEPYNRPGRANFELFREYRYDE